MDFVDTTTEKIRITKSKRRRDLRRINQNDPQIVGMSSQVS